MTYSRISTIDKPKIEFVEPLFALDDNSTTMVANRVYLNPVVIPRALVVDQIVPTWSGVAAGNVRVGLFKDNGNTPVGGALIVESASTAKSGTNRKQEISIAETILTKSIVWVFVYSDEATTQVVCGSKLASLEGTLQPCYFNQAYGALPAVCPALAGSNYGATAMLHVKRVY